MFTFDLAARLEGTGVTVNCLHPATYMATTMVRQAGVDAVEHGRGGRAGDSPACPIADRRRPQRPLFQRPRRIARRRAGLRRQGARKIVGAERAADRAEPPGVERALPQLAGEGGRASGPMGCGKQGTIDGVLRPSGCNSDPPRRCPTPHPSRFASCVPRGGKGRPRAAYPANSLARSRAAAAALASSAG